MDALDSVGHNAGQEACAVVACTSPHPSKCGVTYRQEDGVADSTIFESLMITFESKNSSATGLVMPTTLLRDHMAMAGDKFNYYADDSGKQIMNLSEPRSDILTFGIYKSAAAPIVPTVAVLVTLFVTTLW